jgi:hypothetical protein
MTPTLRTLALAGLLTASGCASDPAAHGDGGGGSGGGGPTGPSGLPVPPGAGDVSP